MWECNFESAICRNCVEAAGCDIDTLESEECLGLRIIYSACHMLSAQLSLVFFLVSPLVSLLVSLLVSHFCLLCCPFWSLVFPFRYLSCRVFVPFSPLRQYAFRNVSCSLTHSVFQSHSVSHCLVVSHSVSQHLVISRSISRSLAMSPAAFVNRSDRSGRKGMPKIWIFTRYYPVLKIFLKTKCFPTHNLTLALLYGLA